MGTEDFINVSSVTFTSADGVEHKLEGVEVVSFSPHSKFKKFARFVGKLLLYLAVFSAVWLPCCFIAYKFFSDDLGKSWIMLWGYFSATIATFLGANASKIGCESNKQSPQI